MVPGCRGMGWSGPVGSTKIRRVLCSRAGNTGAAMAASYAAEVTHDRYGGDVADCAAAYLYHFAINQGFADGNKRTGVVAATGRPACP